MRPVQALPIALFAAALAGCGGGSGGGSTTDPSTAAATATQTTTATPTQPATPAKPSGPDGGRVFASAGCGGCHTLKAAGASGNVGPNLDDLKPSFAIVKAQVASGGGGMPSFGGTLSGPEIAAVARYVSSNAGR